jgi:hypothetical protein
MPPIPGIVQGVSAQGGRRYRPGGSWDKREVYVTVTDRMAVGLKHVTPWVVDWGMRTFYLNRLPEQPPKGEGPTD